MRASHRFRFPGFRFFSALAAAGLAAAFLHGLSVNAADGGAASGPQVPAGEAAVPAAAGEADAAPIPPLPQVPRGSVSQPVVGDPADVHLDKEPPRATHGLDLVKAGWSYNCMECHQLFPARWHYGAGHPPFNEHKDIVLEHGNNRFCLNCHHPTNRNAFVDYDGGEIAQEDVVLLCAKCHGTLYRDWEAGVHGRVNGFWDTAKGPKTKLRCIQCHDPHSPSFKPMKPLPPLSYPDRAAYPPAAGKPEPQPNH